MTVGAASPRHLRLRGAVPVTSAGQTPAVLQVERRLLENPPGGCSGQVLRVGCRPRPWPDLGQGDVPKPSLPAFIFLLIHFAPPAHATGVWSSCLVQALWPRSGPVSSRLGWAGAGGKGSQLHTPFPGTEPAEPCASYLNGPPDCEVLVRYFFFKFLPTYRRLSFLKHGNLFSSLNV